MFTVLLLFISLFNYLIPSIPCTANLLCLLIPPCVSSPALLGTSDGVCLKELVDETSEGVDPHRDGKRRPPQLLTAHCRHDLQK